MGKKEISDSKFCFPSIMKEHIAQIHDEKTPEKIKCSIVEKLFANVP